MQPSLKKNYIYSLFYEVLKLITPLITTPYVARVLEADGVGDYSFTHSIITYFMLFGALGTASYGAREIARSRDDKVQASKLFWEIEIMAAMTSGICILAWIGVIIFSEKYRWFYIALSPFLLSTPFDISWYFYGYEKVKNIVIRNSAVRILSIALVFLLVKKKEDILIYCAIYSFGTLLGNLSMWAYLPKLLTKIPFRELRFRQHFHETIIYFIPTIATSVYTVLDKTLIGVITNNSYQNGFYEEATKIINIVKTFVFTSVNTVMQSRMSYLFAENKIGEIKQKIAKSMDFIYLLAVGGMFGIVGIASTFVPFFLGDGYEPVVTLLYFMSPLILIIGTSNCLGSQYYTPSGQRKRSAKIIVLGAAINLVLNLVLIPVLQAYGAVIASVIAEITITVIYVKMSDGYINWMQLWNSLYKRFIAGSVMCVCVYLIGIWSALSITLTLFIQVAAGGGIYVLMLVLLKDPMLGELFETYKEKLTRKRE